MFRVGQLRSVTLLLRLRGGVTRSTLNLLSSESGSIWSISSTAYQPKDDARLNSLRVGDGAGAGCKISSLVPGPIPRWVLLARNRVPLTCQGNDIRCQPVFHMGNTAGRWKSELPCDDTFETNVAWRLPFASQRTSSDTSTMSIH